MLQKIEELIRKFEQYPDSYGSHRLRKSLALINLEDARHIVLTDPMWEECDSVYFNYDRAHRNYGKLWLVRTEAL